MMKIKLFVKADCPKCPEAKALAAQLNDVELYDIGEVNGLAEAAFYGVMSAPSIVVTDEIGKEMKSWLGVIPNIDELRNVS
ncbi:thioredoxin family protein [Candidatus Oleimmundimicrobium sp.]|uniref:thioredoxin family protein n=1 Tax=Candidatus Oleimmundimicrobium sp. TaxID=3060597 RepID=UPI0027203C8D|nr:thioredoxin family protein [Candidatus Oleimmundimicrobium sp.]MDO8885400.1 thioredoxin family protein [Candidatus Oleimmundimicrobium sp.]